MAEAEGKEQECAASVYEYIENEYKEAWSNEKIEGGWRSDYGEVATNRWEQFEMIYRAKYEKLSASDISTTEFQSRLINRYHEMEEYYDLHDTPVEERTDVLESEKIRQEIQTEMEEDARKYASDSAALEAFNDMTQVVLRMDSETIDRQSEEALDQSKKSKNEKTIEELKKALEERSDQEPEYLVRGAPLRCSCGSHMRYLDMWETHGVYLDDKPVMHKMDCVPEKNIMSFGICSSPIAALTETGSFLVGAETDAEGNYLRSPEDRVITGLVCKPKIGEEGWENCKNETKIAQDATAKTASHKGCTCYEAITTASYLVCEHGGLIFPVGSGQLKYSAYMPPFMNYPYAGNKDAKEEQEAFEKWCQKNDICPYYPGTTEYMDWYQQKIDGLKKRGKSEKTIKEAYEECLDQAYLYGLDRMSEAGRTQVKEMVNQYTGSDLLNETEALAAQKKYAGLRIDFGGNEQRNPVEATPEEDAFYEYYVEKAKEFTQTEEELNEQLRQIRYAGKESVEANAKESTRILTQLANIYTEREKLSKDFEREIGIYGDYLDGERKAQVQEVTDLLQK